MSPVKENTVEFQSISAKSENSGDIKLEEKASILGDVKSDEKAPAPEEDDENSELSRSVLLQFDVRRVC